MKKVPPVPDRIVLQTGDRVRLEVVANQDGFITVFNVGPTGHFNVLYPDPGADTGRAALIRALHKLPIQDVEMTPPAGTERLFAVWSRTPLPLAVEELLPLAENTEKQVSRAYGSTRDMERVHHMVQQLRPEDWEAVVLELEHRS